MAIIFIGWKVYQFTVGKKIVAKAISEGNYILLDVRSEGEFMANSVRDSLNIPVGELSENLDKIDRNKTVLIYCASGTRSAMGKAILLKNGYDNVINAGSVGSVQQILNK